VIELYAVGELAPWPDDVPADARLLASFDQRVLAPVVADLARCLVQVGVDWTGGDWLVEQDRVGLLGRLLHEAAGAPGRRRDVLRELAAAVDAAAGHRLLAVDD
jgi:hypothetical protein